MAQPYVGEIRLFAGNFAPAGWMFCEGQLLPISENETLFQLIGTTYGGDGESTFALPDMRGRLPLHQGNGFILAETGGAEEITLTVQQIPGHNHVAELHARASAVGGNTKSPAGAFLAASGREEVYASFVSDGPLVDMAFKAPPESVTHPNGIPSGSGGGSQPHTNFQPYLCVNYIISLFGIFPSPT